MRKRHLEPGEKNTSFTAFQFLTRMCENWYFFVASVIITLLAGCAYLHLAPPQYVVRASLLLGDDSRGIDLTDPVIKDLGISPESNSIDNEIEVLRSRTLMEEVVRNQNLHIVCKNQSNLTSREFDRRGLLDFAFAGPIPVRSGGRYELLLASSGKCTLVNRGNVINTALGDTLQAPFGKLILHKRKIRDLGKFSIEVLPVDEAVRKYRAKINISSVSKNTSIVNLTLTEEVGEKGERILNELIIVYLRTSRNTRNVLADSTLNFIDENLSAVSAELTMVETEIENFRKTNQHFVFENDNNTLISEQAKHADDYRKLIVKQKIIEMLENQLRRFPERAIPASFFNADFNFADLIKKFNDLQLARESERVTIPGGHPMISQIERQILDVQTQLLTIVSIQKSEIAIQLKESELHSRTFNRELGKIPGLKRKYLSLIRKQEIQQELYKFLLRKRMETSISRSSNLAKAQVIDQPKADEDPVSPNSRLVIAMSLLLGLMIPSGMLILQEILSEKITSKKELSGICPVPVIGEIAFEKKTKWKRNDRSNHIISEQFRTLRTNIGFLPATGPLKKIMITSSMSGEGKSFVAINLAKAFALTGSKVILAELDLRRPVFYKHFNISQKGVTDILAQNRRLNDVLQQPSVYPKFDILTSGRPPTSPSEMLLLPELGALIDSLATYYDQVIIDTPPIGIITDARIIAKHTDLCLFVVRQGMTYRDQVADVDQILQGISQPLLLLNGVKRGPAYQYDYR